MCPQCALPRPSRGPHPARHAKVRRAAETADLGAFHGWQVEKAREAIEMQAVIPSSRPGMFAAVSGDNVTVYLVDAIEQSCTCKAAASGRRCYHPGRRADPVRRYQPPRGLIAMETQMAAAAPLPDLAQLNPLELWLALVRRHRDAGLPSAEARRLADEQAGFSTTTQ